MATDYGSDVSCLVDGVLDLDPYFRVITGTECVLEAVARRLTTSEGGLIDDAEYGAGLTSLVNAAVDNAALLDARSNCEAQCLLDERINDATVAFSVEDGTLTASADVVLVDGETFSLVLAVSAVSVTVLQGD